MLWLQSGHHVVNYFYLVRCLFPSVLDLLGGFWFIVVLSSSVLFCSVLYMPWLLSAAGWEQGRETLVIHLPVEADPPMTVLDSYLNCLLPPRINKPT